MAPNKGDNVRGDRGVYLAAVEGGGTTFVVSVACVLTSDDENISDSSSSTIINIGSTKLQILHTATIPPSDNKEEYTPQQIINEACIFFQKHYDNMYLKQM